jgi:hypothetical protein
MSSWQNVEAVAHLAHTCSVIAREAIADAISSRDNVSQPLSVQVFAIGALAGNGQDLLIFLNSLL